MNIHLIIVLLDCKLHEGRNFVSLGCCYISLPQNNTWHTVGAQLIFVKLESYPVKKWHTDEGILPPLSECLPHL